MIALARRFNAWDAFFERKRAIWAGIGRMNEPKKAPAPKGRKPAEGEKRQFLATMDPEVIKSVKPAAIEDNSSAS